jgi:hypothetical protein
MARISRPPGFDMTYRPTKAVFGPPWGTRLPATLYFGLATVVLAIVLLAPRFPQDSWIYRQIVMGDYHRVVSSTSCAIFLFVSGLASLLRQQMSGVIVHPDGIETREVLALGVPRIKKYAWAQIDRVAVPFAPEALRRGPVDRGASKITRIRLDLWDGSRLFLPDVARTGELSVMIERVALARAIPIDGGSGLLDELGNPFGDGEDEAPAEA